MPTYTPPLRDMQFVMHELLKVVDELKMLPRHKDIDADTINAVLEEGGKFAAEVAFPLNISGDQQGCKLDKATHEVRTPEGFKEAYAKYVEGGWPSLSLRPGLRRPGPAGAGEPVLLRDAELGQPGLDHVPGPVARRLRLPARARHPEQKALYLPKLDQRRVDRHHVPDRAALRHRPGPAAHQGRAAARRQLQDHRPEDLHQRRRARPGRQHHPPGAGAAAGCAGRQQGHLAVRRAQVPRSAPTASRASATASSAARWSTRWASTAAPPAR
jgi:hypothetical protein